VKATAPTSAKALAREKVKGLWIAIPTPFTPDGRHVDEDALASTTSRAFWSMASSAEA
jgi:dihydrodipicolinate synthase/N-acetylneuraminate lyase